jgi:molybdopterin converting factor small subunit
MRVSVRFLGMLRDQVGQKSLDVDLPEGASFDELMDAIAPALEHKVGDWAWDKENRRFSPRVVVRRQDSRGTAVSDGPLVEGEEVVVFPPLAGG